MARALRERDGYAGLIEATLDLVGIFPQQVKIVRILDPGPKRHLYGTVREGRYKELGHGILQEQGLFFHQVTHDSQSLVRRVAIADAHLQFQTAAHVLAEIHNGLPSKGAVRRRHKQAIYRFKRGVEKPDPLDFALDRAALDVMTRLEGPNEHEQKSGSNI